MTLRQPDQSRPELSAEDVLAKALRRDLLDGSIMRDTPYTTRRVFARLWLTALREEGYLVASQADIREALFDVGAGTVELDDAVRRLTEIEHG